MAGLIPLPQTVIHNSSRLTHREAHTLLSSFLTEADTNPAYRPDAVLTPHGAQATGIGSGSNLTLVHLDRILKGIAGTRVGGIEFNYGTGPPRKKRKIEDNQTVNGGAVKNGGNETQEDVVEMVDGDEEGQVALVGRETGDWQDKEDYELAQVDETADLEGRDPADAGDEEAAPTIDAVTRTDEVEVGSVTENTKSKNERDKRKLAKQDRRKKEKTYRNEEHKQKAKAKD